MAGASAAGEVLAILQEHPGIGVRELGRLASHSLTTVLKALERLEADWAIVSRSDGRTKRLFVTGLSAPPAQLSTPLTDLIRMLRAAGGSMLVAELVRASGAPRVTTRHRVGQLQRRGLAQVKASPQGLLVQLQPEAVT